jgi:membrane protein
VAEAVPAAAADVAVPLVDAAVDQRDSVTGIGLAAAVWAGIWWMSNMREAVSAQWCLPPLGPASARRVLLDLTALLGLAAALLGSAAGTVIATGAVEGLVGALGLRGSWAGVLVGSTGSVLGVGANWVVLLWILARLPREPRPWREVRGAALVGAVGVGVLELSLTTFLGSVTDTPGGAVFGSLLGVLLFVYLVSRFVLLLAAWTATARPVPAPTAVRPSPAPPGPVAGPRPGLLAALLSGVVVGLVLRRGRDRPPADR